MDPKRQLADRIVALCKSSRDRMSNKMKALLYCVAVVGPEGGVLENVFADGVAKCPRRTVDFAVGLVEMMEAGQFEEAERAMNAADLRDGGPSA